MLSLKLSLMSAKDRGNLNVFTVALFIVCHVTQCTMHLAVQCFYLSGNKDSSVPSSTRDKMVAITFHESQILDLENQYHNDAT